jgi:hypothetical protein
LWWSADIPPSNSRDHGAMLALGNESNADPLAGTCARQNASMTPA